MVSRKAYSELQKGKVTTSEITEIRAGTTLKNFLVLPWPWQLSRANFRDEATET